MHSAKAQIEEQEMNMLKRDQLFGLLPFLFTLYLQNPYAAIIKIKEAERLRALTVIILIRLLPAERVTRKLNCKPHKKHSKESKEII